MRWWKPGRPGRIPHGPRRQGQSVKPEYGIASNNHVPSQGYINMSKSPSPCYKDERNDNKEELKALTIVSFILLGCRRKRKKCGRGWTGGGNIARFKKVSSSMIHFINPFQFHFPFQQTPPYPHPPRRRVQTDRRRTRGANKASPLPNQKPTRRAKCLESPPEKKDSPRHHTRCPVP